VATDSDRIEVVVDWERARREGAARQRIKAATTGGRAYHSDPDHENVVGLAGEGGFGHRYGLPVPTYHLDCVADEGYDFPTTLNRIDTKTCKFKPYYLGVPDTGLAKRPGANVYVLLHCPLNEPIGWIVGWVERDEVYFGRHVLNIFEQDRAVPSRLVPGYVIPVAELRAPRLLPVGLPLLYF
jgi:hypothetical protein